MRMRKILAVSIGLTLAGVMTAAAQTSGAGTPVQGFTPQTLIMKLSLYLPEDATRNAFAGGGQRAGAGAPASGGSGAGGQGGTGAQAGGGQNGQRTQFPQMQFTRDAKLFLTKDQINKLLPILQALRENPMPSPSKAKKVESDIDAILTVAQKAEWDGFQKEMDKFRQDAQRRAGANGSGSGGGTGQQFQNFQDMTPEQRQQLLDSLTPEQRQAVQNRMQQQGSQQTLSPTERRQRQLDEFIKMLQDRVKQL